MLGWFSQMGKWTGGGLFFDATYVFSEVNMTNYAGWDDKSDDDSIRLERWLPTAITDNPYGPTHGVAFTPPFKELCMTLDAFHIKRGEIIEETVTITTMQIYPSLNLDAPWTYSFYLFDAEPTLETQPCDFFCRFTWPRPKKP